MKPLFRRALLALPLIMLVACKPPPAEFKENTLLKYIPDLQRNNCPLTEYCGYATGVQNKELLKDFQKVNPGFTAIYKEPDATGSGIIDGIADEKGNALEVGWVGDGRATIEIPEVGEIDQEQDNTGRYWTTISELKKKWADAKAIGNMQADKFLMQTVKASILNPDDCTSFYCQAETKMNPSAITELIKNEIGLNMQFDQRPDGSHTIYEASTPTARIVMEPETYESWWITVYWGNQQEP